jgi:hypothetical protein
MSVGVTKDYKRKVKYIVYYESIKREPKIVKKFVVHYKSRKREL